MRFSKFIATGAVAVVLTTTASCGLPHHFRSQVVGERNLFTGLAGANGKVLAVKFDDTRNAHPQKGVEAADIVFVTQVEAGLTRLLAIYSSNYPELIGPIRSARISDIDILAQFGKVAFAYSGAQSKMRPILASANLLNQSAERNPSTIYPSDPNRIPPYAMMLHPNLLLSKSADATLPRKIGIEHGNAAKSAERIDSVIVHWPNAKYEARWNSTEERFLLWHDGNPDMNADGKQLGSPMIVIQEVEIHPSEFGDKFGGITPKSTVTGNGLGYFLRNGSLTKVRWSRPTADSPTKWTLLDGEPAYFAQGQIWFFLTDKEPEFGFPVPASASSAKK